MATTTITTQAVMPPSQVVTHVPPSVVHVAPEGPHPATAHKKAFTIVGVIQISVGVLSIILGGVATGLYYGYLYYPASSIWSGAWYIASGGLALSTGMRATTCNVVAGMVISILATLVAFGVGISEAVLAAAWNCFGLGDCSANSRFIGIHGTLAFLAFVEFITAIVHSAYCCAGACGSSNQQGRVVAATTTYMNVPVVQTQMPMQQPYVQHQCYAQPPMMQMQPHAEPPSYSAQSQVPQPPVYEQNQKQPL